MSKHIFKVLSIAGIVMLLMMFIAAPVAALDVRSGDTVTVADGEAVAGPLFAWSSDTITIDGTINGGLWAGGKTININGTVTGSVVAVGQTINIKGNVDGNLIVSCLQLNIASTAKINGSILFAGGIASIQGEVKGGSSILPGILPVGNAVNGNGNLQFISKVTDTPSFFGGEPAIPNPFTIFSGALGKLMGFLTALIAGLVIILIAPKKLTSLAESIRAKPWPSAGWGVVILVVVPLAALLVCLTLIGISVGLIAMAIYGIAVYLAQIPVSLLIGRLIIGRSRAVEGKGIMIGALALGLLIITLLKLIPFAGFFIGLAVIIVGLGALVVSGKQCRAESCEVASTES